MNNPHEQEQVNFVAGEQAPLPSTDYDGKPINQTSDEMHSAGSAPVALDPRISNFQNSTVSTIGGHSVCGAAHEIVPPAQFPTPGAGAGSPAPPPRASGGLGSSAYGPLPGWDE
jgi:hypothetical protein